MILRRFTQHIKEQNWFAVGLDVIVVIVGIFLGMQVSDWNEAQKDRQLEKVYLERLKIDLEENIKTIEHAVTLHQSIRKAINDTASFLMSDTWDDEKHDAIKKQRLAWGAFPTVPLQTGAWDELVSTGRLSLVNDSDVRDSLQKAASEMDFVRSQMIQLVKVDSFWGKGFTKFTNLRRAESGEMFIRSDFSGVFGDEEFVTSLLLTAGRQGRAYGLRVNQAKTNKKALEMVKCRLAGKNCKVK